MTASAQRPPAQRVDVDGDGCHQLQRVPFAGERLELVFDFDGHLHHDTCVLQSWRNL